MTLRLPPVTLRLPFVLAVALLATPAASQDAGPGLDPSLGIDLRIEDTWDDDESFDPEAVEPEVPGAHLLRRPLRINSASEARLAEVPGIGPDVARRIVGYRRLHGSFGRLEDLLRVPGVDAPLLEEIGPYLVFESARSGRREPRAQIDQRIHRRIDMGRGYAEQADGKAYAGSPHRLFSRLEMAPSDRLSLALVGEKDPGEVWYFSPRSGALGFDSVTLYAAVERIGFVDRLILGDFHARFGLGLHLWTSGRFSSLHTDAAAVVSTGPGLAPHRSGGETAFLRGFGAAFRLPIPIRIQAFASRRGRDARLVALSVSDENDPAFGIASMPTSGLHRTGAEREGRAAVVESLTGLAIEWVSNPASIGLVVSRLDLSLPLTPDMPLYRAMQQPQLGSTSWSLFGSAGASRWRGAGELGCDADGSCAWAFVLRTDPGPRSRLVAVHRNYPATYAAPRGSGPSRRSGPPWNESGWILSLDGQISSTVTARLAVDQYRYPGPRFDSLLPARGLLVSAAMAARPVPRLRVEVQGLHGLEEKPRPVVDEYGRALPGLSPTGRSSFRLSAETFLHRSIRVRLRIASTRSSASDARSSMGMLLHQEVLYHPFPKLRMQARLTLFDAPDYAARIGSGESDLLGSPLRATLQGRGERSFVLVDFRPSTLLTIRLKASTTRRSDVDFLGSGHDRVDGNRVREIRAQFMYRIRRPGAGNAT